ncbi:MAG: glycosyltransferase family 1 protein, partial [Leptospiraceae bacterium]|nr:glycosyltransferase family 1 protein [Leptospiraceae bacterium]
MQTRIIAVDARPLTNRLSGVARVIANVIAQYPDSKTVRFDLHANRDCHPDFAWLLELAHIRWCT